MHGALPPRCPIISQVRLYPTPLLALFAVPVVSTVCGGLLALRYRRWTHMLLAAGAGILLGAAFLDLLPEALTLGAQAHLTAADVLGATLGSFLLFFVIDMALGALVSPEALDSERPRSRTSGRIAATMLILHSFRDGMAIGASYAAAPVAGYAVAAGIGAHDLGDGLNTVLLTTRGGRAGAVDYLFLAADALAPVAGGVAAFFFFSSLRDSTFLLAAAAGFFLQMAAGELLPQVRQQPLSRGWTALAVLAGAGLIYGATLLLQGLS